MAFSGMAGNGRLRHRLGREGSSLLRVVSQRGDRMNKEKAKAKFLGEAETVFEGCGSGEQSTREQNGMAFI